MKPSSFVREIPITDVPGLRIGHAENEEAKTGVTVLIFDQGAAAGVDISGGGQALPMFLWSASPVFTIWEWAGPISAPMQPWATRPVFRQKTGSKMSPLCRKPFPAQLTLTKASAAASEQAAEPLSEKSAAWSVP